MTELVPLAPEELDAAMEYLHETDFAAAAMVTACVQGARAYLWQNCGVALPRAGTPRRAQYDLVCHALAADAYDRRSTVITGAAVSANPVFESLKNGLKFTEPNVSDLDASVEERKHG